jgi:hypothetical protein
MTELSELVCFEIWKALRRLIAVDPSKRTPMKIQDELFLPLFLELPTRFSFSVENFKTDWRGEKRIATVLAPFGASTLD